MAIVTDSLYVEILESRLEKVQKDLELTVKAVDVKSEFQSENVSKSIKIIEEMGEEIQYLSAILAIKENQRLRKERSENKVFF